MASVLGELGLELSGMMVSPGFRMHARTRTPTHTRTHTHTHMHTHTHTHARVFAHAGLSPPARPDCLCVQVSAPKGAPVRAPAAAHAEEDPEVAAALASVLH
jgi:hypothetical protein